jgi:hypothetical protein
MKKIIKITESQINRIVSNTLNEDYEMKNTTPRRDFKPTSREKQLKDVFGSYSEDVPPVVLRYMRKNPKAIIQKLYDIYGDKMFDYIQPEFPLDEATYSVDVDDIDKVKDKLPQDAEVKVIDEYDDLLDEDIFEEEDDIDNWDDVPMMK